jgi:hypothetical protein
LQVSAGGQSGTPVALARTRARCRLRIDARSGLIVWPRSVTRWPRSVTREAPLRMRA